MLRSLVAWLVVGSVVFLGACSGEDDRGSVESATTSPVVSDAAVLDAAARAAVEMIGYDYRTFDDEAESVEPFMSENFLPSHLRLLNALSTSVGPSRTVVTARPVSAGVCGRSEKGVEVLVFSDVTVVHRGGAIRNVFPDSAALLMVRAGERWVIDKFGAYGGFGCTIADNDPGRRSALRAAQEYSATRGTPADEVAVGIVAIDGSSATVIASTYESPTLKRSKLNLVLEQGTWRVSASDDV